MVWCSSPFRPLPPISHTFRPIKCQASRAGLHGNRPASGTRGGAGQVFSFFSFLPRSFFFIEDDCTHTNNTSNRVLFKYTSTLPLHFLHCVHACVLTVRYPGACKCSHCVDSGSCWEQKHVLEEVTEHNEGLVLLSYCSSEQHIRCLSSSKCDSDLVCLCSST